MYTGWFNFSEILDYNENYMKKRFQNSGFFTLRVNIMNYENSCIFLIDLFKKNVNLFVTCSCYIVAFLFCSFHYI